jgi:hypothetical protein
VIFHPETPTSDNVVRIYIDQNGSVYPKDRKYDVKDNVFYSPDNGNVADLKSYYTKNDVKTYKKLQRHYHLKKWSAIQDTMLTECANLVNQKLQPNGKLVILVHSFNNPMPENDYQEMEEAINAKLHNNNTVYLEVYWDGFMTKKKTDDASKMVWEAAQRSSAKAGLTLRKVLDQVDNGDVYVVTHSSGAGVGTALLFNLEGKKSRMSTGANGETIYTPRQSNVTFAMIAPAIEGKEAFESIKNTVPKDMGYNYKKIVVGYNMHDYTVMKGIEKHPTAHYSDDLLGANIEEVRKTQQEVKRARPTITFDVTDFTFEGDAETATNSLAVYMQSPKFKEFMDYTFGAN